MVFETVEEETNAMENYVRVNPTEGSELVKFLYYNITKPEVMRNRMMSEDLQFEQMQGVYYTIVHDTPFRRHMWTMSYASAALNEAFRGISSWRC